MTRSENTEKLTLLKKDGRQFSDVYAIVSGNSVFIEDGTLPLDKGDHLLRQPGTNAEEMLRVLDPGHKPAIQLFKEHYQAKVEHVEGGVVSQTIDSDIHWRYFEQMPVSEIFKQTRKIIFENCVHDRQSELLLEVDELEKKSGTSEYLKLYQAFIRNNADHLAMLSPVLPALTKLLS